MVHLLPHWTHPGKEGVEIPLVVYTNGDAAELFLNGKSLGKKAMDRDEMQIVWLVPYKAGILTAVAYKNGKEIARKSETTASSPAAVKLTADRKAITANKRDVVYIVADIVDAKGNFVPYANNEITFEVTGPYKLIGVENGDIIDVSPHKVLNRKAFMGKALLILQATDQKGKLVVRGVSPGLKSTEVSVICN
jgi:beta-galactosidase